MQFPSILLTLAAAQAMLGAAAAGVVAPRTPETFTLCAEVPVLPEGWGYLITPAPYPGTSGATHKGRSE
jgi:hypothetical protein